MMCSIVKYRKFLKPVFYPCNWVFLTAIVINKRFVIIIIIIIIIILTYIWETLMVNILST